MSDVENLKNKLSYHLEAMERDLHEAQCVMVQLREIPTSQRGWTHIEWTAIWQQLGCTHESNQEARTMVAMPKEKTDVKGG